MTLPFVQNSNFKVLGIRLSTLQLAQVVNRIEEWIHLGTDGKYVCLTNVHSVTEAHRNAQFRTVLNSADLCVPDGMPLVWFGRALGHRLARRVYGPELMLEFFRCTSSKGYRHFFYGATQETLDSLMTELKTLYPDLEIAGAHSPPFRHLSAQEDECVVELINRSDADILWVGLGCPKQETWMYEHRDKLKVRAMLGVGQAFAIHAHLAPQAPFWLREHGLEWLFRLVAEPRRLWKRYLIYNSQFICLLFIQALKLKTFD